VGVTLRDTDHGYAALAALVYGFARPTIAVGILDRGTDPHEGTDLTVLEVAVWNEFGTRSKDGTVRVPARSFIRAWFDENREEIRAWMATMMRSVLAGKRSKERALELVALKCVGSIQERMARGIAPPNAPSTALRKGSSTPLIATGQLRSSVTFRVTP
jgi:hypothetical protein